ncbi:MAG TPA: hypothetical protein VGM57_01040 [Pseudolabrys sp.]|jgi:hypothetical protein
MALDNPQLHRIIAILLGAAVLFGLELGFGVSYYVAIPACIIVYTACRLGFALLIPQPPAK